MVYFFTGNCDSLVGFSRAGPISASIKLCLYSYSELLTYAVARQCGDAAVLFIRLMFREKKHLYFVSSVLDELCVHEPPLKPTGQPYITQARTMLAHLGREKNIRWLGVR